VIGLAMVWIRRDTVLGSDLDVSEASSASTNTGLRPNAYRVSREMMLYPSEVSNRKLVTTALALTVGTECG
jgi:hypothetical protein